MFEDDLIDLALKEDLGLGDVTCDYLIPSEHRAAGHIVAKKDTVVCGFSVAKKVFAAIDPAIVCEVFAADGSKVGASNQLCKISGPYRSVLKAERTALNFMQRLSGIATLTRQYVEAVKDFDVRVCDTRKTMPGYRTLDKYAVRCGGGSNHRMGLGDVIMLKENHLACYGSILEALNAAKRDAPHTARIIIEVETLDQFRDALAGKADVILCDHFDLGDLKKGVALAQKSDTLVEASGNVTLESVRKYAECGVDVISVGALTHSVMAADLSLLVEMEPADP